MHACCIYTCHVHACIMHMCVSFFLLSIQAYENKDVPKGVIRLSDITKVYQNMRKKDHLMRNILTIETSLRTYLVQAPSITTMYIWQTCLSIPPHTFEINRQLVVFFLELVVSVIPLFILCTPIVISVRTCPYKSNVFFPCVECL